VAGAAGTPAAGGAGRDLLALERARDELGLDDGDFELALQIGEIRTVVCGPGWWKVPRAETARLLGPEGGTDALRERLRLVSGTGAADVIGISRDRFVRLARAGCVSPVRWYVNQYRAVVWLYLARDLSGFAVLNRPLLTGRLPQDVREASASGADHRARRWRERRTAQLVRDAHDPWEEAAVWSALLGPDITGEAVPDPYERSRLGALRTALPPGRTGRATPGQIRAVTTAGDPDEIAGGLLALADALGRARVGRPASRRAPVPEHPESQPPAAPVVPPAPAFRRTLPSPGSRPSPPPGTPPRGAAQPGPGGGGPDGTGPGGRRRMRGLRGLLPALRRSATAASGQSSPTSVSRITARPSSSEVARSTSAEMPQP
jgi:hypothetical protein